LAFFIDSELVVKQMNGQYRIKNRDLWPIHNDIKRLSENFESVTFSHVRREQNKLADLEVNRILDQTDA
jgi:ribonuclease HI